ncbi:hypothetical protein ABTX15_20745 [Micromonospora sp. NPDC094482]|uniref:hypothetical protein n=1 Tax=unclassified Micromonospora TaxID=2617518 RepID=UPI00333247D7
MSLADLIAEPLRATRAAEPAVRERVAELAELVGLTSDLLPRRPHAVSDGNCNVPRPGPRPPARLPAL